MKITGFTYIRNGVNYNYPFIQSIKSILPIVDQLIVVVGDSNDKTRELIENIKSPKIDIIDTVWNDDMRKNGKIFAMQSNIGLENAKGDWLIHIQADELIHEDDTDKLLNYIKKHNENPKIEGLLFPYYHFWGDYNYIRKTRRTHNFEIRAFRNDLGIRSYKDSQGFRKYSSKDAYENNETGEKIKVAKIDIPIYHYSYVRNPKYMKKKSNYFHRFWHNDKWIKENTEDQIFDYNEVDKLSEFKGKHPKLMEEIIKQKDWVFNYDPSKSNMSFKDRILNKFEEIFGIRPFSYKNYKII